jgi:drug/metabolite transporter (DMT)-like permease
MGEIVKKDNHQLKKLVAFTIIYFVWGITYLAIRLAIDTIPPFLMAGMRFTIAGLLFYTWCYIRFDKKPGLKDWGNASIPGILMFVFGNGSLTWSEQFIPSGLAALIIATISIWMVLLDWLIYNGKRPDKLTLAGISLGIAGVALLSIVDDNILLDSYENNASVFGGISLLLFAAISWAAGSVYSRHVKFDVSLQFIISMQILVGGIVLILIGSFCGEWSEFSVQNISFLSYMALIYLIVFGSLLAYSAYIWLLRVSTPAKVGTYAFFNPLVAVFLGWLLLKEPVTLQTLLASGCILISILLVNRPKWRNR